MTCNIGPYLLVGTLAGTYLACSSETTPEPSHVEPSGGANSVDDNTNASGGSGAPANGEGGDAGGTASVGFSCEEPIACDASYERPSSPGGCNALWSWSTDLDEARLEPNKTRANEHSFPFVFIGDSITAMWAWDPPQTGGKLGGRNVWNEVFAPMGAGVIGRGLPNNAEHLDVVAEAALFGNGGDATGNLLWRIDNNEFAGLNGDTKVIVLMIGTNSLTDCGGEDVEAGAQGISAAIEAAIEGLRCQVPSARILLLSILPRGSQGDLFQPYWPEKIRRTNELLGELHDGKTVVYMDLHDLFWKDGDANSELLNDFTHPSPAGFQAWADAILPTLEDMLACEDG